MATAFIELNQLSDKNFIGVVKDGKLEIQLKSIDYTLLPIRTYIATPNTNVVTMNAGNTEQRRRLQVQGNFGIFHLDFTANTVDALNSSTAFTLPDDAPTPKALIEIQVRNGGTIWVVAGQRTVRYKGLEIGQRYIVDLIGFWE